MGQVAFSNIFFPQTNINFVSIAISLLLADNKKEKRKGKEKEKFIGLCNDTQT